jgi:hypothetical protein
MKLFNTLITGGLLTLSFLIIPTATKAQTFREKVAENAVKEWQNFHNPPIVVKSKADTNKLSKNPLEYDQCRIVNRYWGSVKTPPNGDFCRLSKTAAVWDNYPWSAAFISYIMGKSGAEEDKFRPSVRHATYIVDAVKNRDIPKASFRGYPIDWIRPAVGDLICAPRGENKDLRYSQILDKKDFKSHCDIVVAKNGNQLEVIGGNVGDSVAKTIVFLDAEGHIKVTEPNFRPWFVIIKNNLK